MDAWWLQKERKATKASRIDAVWPGYAGQHWEGFPSRQTLVRQAQSTEHIAYWAGSAAVSGRETGRGGTHTSPTISHERV